jgi:hypothetical protein
MVTSLSDNFTGISFALILIYQAISLRFNAFMLLNFEPFFVCLTE